MAEIVFAFANNSTSPLPALTTEQKHIEDLKDKLSIHKCAIISNATLASLEEHINEDTRYVHFSGHIEGDNIILFDEFGKESHLSSVRFSQIFERQKVRKLDLIFINACASYTFFEALKPIAKKLVLTSTKVGDKFSAELSRRFYYYFFEKKNTVRSCFMKAKKETTEFKLDYRQLSSDSNHRQEAFSRGEGAKTDVISQFISNKFILYLQSRDRVFFEEPTADQQEVKLNIVLAAVDPDNPFSALAQALQEILISSYNNNKDCLSSKQRLIIEDLHKNPGRLCRGFIKLLPVTFSFPLSQLLDSVQVEKYSVESKLLIIKHTHQLYFALLQNLLYYTMVHVWEKYELKRESLNPSLLTNARNIFNDDFNLFTSKTVSKLKLLFDDINSQPDSFPQNFIKLKGLDFQVLEEVENRIHNFVGIYKSNVDKFNDILESDEIKQYVESLEITKIVAYFQQLSHFLDFLVPLDLISVGNIELNRIKRINREEFKFTHTVIDLETFDDDSTGLKTKVYPDSNTMLMQFRRRESDSLEDEESQANYYLDSMNLCPFFINANSYDKSPRIDLFLMYKISDYDMYHIRFRNINNMGFYFEYLDEEKHGISSDLKYPENVDNLISNFLEFLYE